ERDKNDRFVKSGAKAERPERRISALQYFEMVAIFIISVSFVAVGIIRIWLANSPTLEFSRTNRTPVGNFCCPRNTRK
ncbi:hypothetical protein, partial [Phaeobacter sp. B1627]|uniref:hypothetical protein n=1 Tax=Phaeobacter sp. B1627 TaxID=2583809 RepID=UPI001C4012BF